MSKISKDQSKKIVKKTAAYLYLYGAFLAIFCYWAYKAQLADRPLSYFFLFFISLFLWIIYVLVNHLLIKRILGTKTVVIFESILFLTLFALERCYDVIWDSL